MSLSSLWQEFKSFAFKGNMIDLAIAVIIGGAFGKVISSLVDHILMPLIAAIVPNSGGYEDLSFTINGSEILYGQFLGALFNFLIVAIAIFIAVVKTLGALQRLAKAPPEPGEPTTKECPYCLSNIPLKASRCAHCTSEVSPA